LTSAAGQAAATTSRRSWQRRTRSDDVNAVALDNQRLLMLSRDGNGVGNATCNSAPDPIGDLPHVFKSVLLADLALGSPTNFAGTSRDAEGGKITQSAGVLASGVVPVTHEGSVEPVEFHSARQLQLRDRCRRHDAGQPADAQ
jgi:hypothetical protein